MEEEQVRIVMTPGWEKHIAPELAEALHKLAEEILADAKRLVPVDTGRLRDSLKVEVTEDAVAIGSDVEYALDVELGTRHQAAQPYLKPALYKNREG